MCCLFAVLAILGPRAALGLWWLVDQSRFNLVYDTFILPFLGFLFLPVTTIMWTLVWIPGGINGWNWIWIALGVVADIAGYSGGGYGGYKERARIPGMSSS